MQNLELFTCFWSYAILSSSIYLNGMTAKPIANNEWPERSAHQQFYIALAVDIATAYDQERLLAGEALFVRQYCS